MKINIEIFQKLLQKKLISVQAHPELPLNIWNYTVACQYDKSNWNEHTLMCRGLITDLDNNIVSRPMDKFFNLSEHTEESSTLPKIDFTNSYEVTEKFDGSLGISYPTKNGYALSTRGSFTSDQAIKGTEMLQKLNTKSMSDNYTYMFEIIYPENRIVVDYGKEEKLILLCIRNNDTGDYFDYEMVVNAAEVMGCEVAKKLDMSIEDIKTLSSNETKNREGVVVSFSNGTKVKVKLDEYVRLHKILTGINPVHIWEMLKDGKPLNELIELVPDEFYEWVRATEKELILNYNTIESMCKDTIKALTSRPLSRREYAAVILHPIHKSYSGVLFAMLDNKNYSDTIWKMIKPKSIFFQMMIYTCDQRVTQKKIQLLKRLYMMNT